MSHIMCRVVVVVMLAMMGVYEVKGESSSQTGLLLNVKCMNLSGQTTNEFAANEPVWLSLELLNTSSAPVSVWVDGDENRGITCRPADSYDAKARLIYQDLPLERNFKETVLAPGGELRADVPLSDFLKIQDEGTFAIACEMQVKDGKGKPLHVKAIVPLRFTKCLSAQKVSSLVAQLQEQFNSGDERMRVRMVRSCSSLPSSAVMGFLAKALSGNNERVQLATLNVLSIMDIPRDETMPLLQKAAQSEQESVRQRATVDIEKRQRR